MQIYAVLCMHARNAIFMTAVCLHCVATKL